MLEEKIEALTKEVVALRQTIEKNGTAAGTKAAEKAAPVKKGSAKKAAADDDDDDDDDADEVPAKKAPAKKAPAKKKVAEPEHDEDEVGSIFRKAAKIDKPKCKKYLAKVECEDLAELLTKPELYDAAFDFAEAIIDADDDDDDDDDDV
jgi:hypothetical protein